MTAILRIDHHHHHDMDPPWPSLPSWLRSCVKISFKHVIWPFIIIIIIIFTNWIIISSIGISHPPPLIPNHPQPHHHHPAPRIKINTEQCNCSFHTRRPIRWRNGWPLIYPFPTSKIENGNWNGIHQPLHPLLLIRRRRPNYGWWEWIDDGGSINMLPIIEINSYRTLMPAFHPRVYRRRRRPTTMLPPRRCNLMILWPIWTAYNNNKEPGLFGGVRTTTTMLLWQMSWVDWRYCSTWMTILPVVPPTFTNPLLYNNSTTMRMTLRRYHSAWSLPLYHKRGWYWSFHNASGQKYWNNTPGIIGRPTRGVPYTKTRWAANRNMSFDPICYLPKSKSATKIPSREKWERKMDCETIYCVHSISSSSF